jgi:hypothetical protein
LNMGFQERFHDWRNASIRHEFLLKVVLKFLFYERLGTPRLFGGVRVAYHSVWGFLVFFVVVALCLVFNVAYHSGMSTLNCSFGFLWCYCPFLIAPSVFSGVIFLLVLLNNSLIMSSKFFAWFACNKYIQ